MSGTSSPHSCLMWMSPTLLSWQVVPRDSDSWLSLFIRPLEDSSLKSKVFLDDNWTQPSEACKVTKQTSLTLTYIMPEMSLPHPTQTWVGLQVWENCSHTLWVGLWVSTPLPGVTGALCCLLLEHLSFCFSTHFAYPVTSSVTFDPCSAFLSLGSISSPNFSLAASRRVR